MSAASAALTLGVDHERCVGAGMCALTAPALFDQSDDTGQALLLDATPPPAHHAAAYEAADLCPAAAVTVTVRR